jgi:GNAT superfamily N-acetyltransferase
MTIRELSLPKDLVPLENMLVRTFQYPDNPEWGIQADEEDDIAREIRTLRKMWPVIRILQLLSPSLRDMLRGFVWEEDGTIGAVVIVQRGGTTNTWGVGIVGVLPEFRRRGLARKLLTRALDDLRQRGAQRINLGVIEKNVPAYALYRSLGFEHYSSMIEYGQIPDHAPAAVACPQSYEESTLSRSDWKSRYALEKRITPNEIAQYDPVEIGCFRTPIVQRALGPVMDFLKRNKQERFLYKCQGAVVGLLRHSTSRSGKGTSSITMRLDPAHPELAPYMLVKAMRAVIAINPTLRIQFGVTTWMPPLMDAAQDCGFTERVRYHMLGLIP